MSSRVQYFASTTPLSNDARRSVGGGGVGANNVGVDRQEHLDQIEVAAHLGQRRGE